MTTTKPKIVRHVLSLKESIKLAKFIESDYAMSGKTDVDFAKRATEVLGFNVNSTHIATNRIAQDIPSNKQVAMDQVGNHLGLLARVQELEEQMKKLQATVSKLVASNIEHVRLK